MTVATIAAARAAMGRDARASHAGVQQAAAAVANGRVLVSPG
jgi:hypothetical protein